MNYKKIIAACFKIHGKHISTFSGRMQNCWMLNLFVIRGATGPLVRFNVLKINYRSPAPSLGITHGSLFCFVDQQQRMARLVNCEGEWKHTVQLISSKLCNKKHIKLVLKRKLIFLEAQKLVFYLRCPRNLILYSMQSVIYGSVYHSGKLDSAKSKSEVPKIRNWHCNTKMYRTVKMHYLEKQKNCFFPLLDNIFLTNEHKMKKVEKC